MAQLRSLIRIPVNQYSCLFVPRLAGLACRHVHTSPVCHILKLHQPTDALKPMTQEIEQETTTYDEPVGPARVDPRKFRHGAGVFPTKAVYDMKVGGVPYTELPTVHILAHYSNTIITVTDQGKAMGHLSGGMMGLATAKKGTSVAAEMIASTLARQMVKKGIVNVRVIIKGISMNHVSAMEALVESGMNVISITDNTFYNRGYKRKNKPVR